MADLAAWLDGPAGKVVCGMPLGCATPEALANRPLTRRGWAHGFAMSYPGA